jgi:hypothetical protein
MAVVVTAGVSAVVALTRGLVAVVKEQKRTQLAREAEGRRRRQAQEALDALTSPLVEEWLTKRMHVAPEHEQFLRQALKAYEDFGADTEQDEEARGGVARAVHNRRSP